MTAPKEDPLIRDLERAIRSVLKDKGATMIDKLKAAEIGAKLVLARHRVEGSVQERSFFGNGVDGHA